MTQTVKVTITDTAGFPSFALVTRLFLSVHPTVNAMPRQLAWC